jgi:hypothetical protein
MRRRTCLLCGKIGELATTSHIIPKFMYKGMENDKNKIGLTTLKNNIKAETEIDYRYFDKDILCLDCETIKLSQLDKYGNRVLFGDQKTKDLFKSTVLEYPNAKVCVIENFDYLKLKLFLLSVLWRAHISSHVFFENVNLSSRDGVIRQAILSKDLSSCEDVKISIFGLMFDRNKLMKAIPKPRHIITESIDVYLFMIYGIVYNFIYKDDNNTFNFGENTLQENQPLKMPFYLGADAMNYFRAFVLPKE